MSHCRRLVRRISAFPGPGTPGTSHRPPPTMSYILDVSTPAPRAVDITFTSDSDFALALVLQNIKLRHLIRLRKVNRQWKRVIETLCRSRQSLRLFGWPYSKEENDELFYGPGFHHLDGPKMTFLARLLPNITSFGVICTERYMATVTLALLPKWSSKLEKLSIRGLPKNKALESKLLNAVKSLPKLQALSLFGLSDHIVPVQLPKKMPVLKQLSTFMLEGYSGDLTAIFMQLGPPISRLFINSEQKVNLYTEQLASFLQANPKIGSELTYLDLGLIPDNAGALWRLICTHFTSLTHLEVSFLFGLTFDDTLPWLHQLKSLVKLNFNVDLKKGRYETIETLEPLENVKILFLGAVADASFDLETFRTTVGRMFPALEELRIASFSPNAVDELIAEVKNIFPSIKKHQIGLANRNKMEVGVQKRIYGGGSGSDSDDSDDDEEGEGSETDSSETD